MTQIYRPEDDPVDLEIPSGTPIYVDSQEDPIGYVADQCHAVMWMEQGKNNLVGTDQVTRWRLTCRFATGHEDAFHENHDGTRWMVQTEDR